MITEGIVALIWATVSSWFFFDGGAAETGASLAASAPDVVVKVSENWLGIIGGILAVLGVVAAPITSGDTAFRSARLIVADFLHLTQKPIRNRLIISIPLFIIAGFLLWYNIADEDGFNVIWRYFGWANQTLAVFMLWTATAYLLKNKKGNAYLITMLLSCVHDFSLHHLSLRRENRFQYAAVMELHHRAVVFVLSIAIFYYLKATKAGRD